MRHLALTLISTTLCLVNSLLPSYAATPLQKDLTATLVPQPRNRVCSTTESKRVARCHATVVKTVQPNDASLNLPTGYGPTDLLSAYQLTGWAQTVNIPTIAVVDAYDNPNIETELNVYNQTYGLPPCTTTNGCFKKVGQRGEFNQPIRSSRGQRGQTMNPVPTYNEHWALEIALDVEIAHAVCQNCRILLVEADDANLDNLGTAVNQAVKMGAVVVSNSYGVSEFNTETQYDRNYYNHPNVAVIASAGDSGYGVEYPAASPYVTAVGGTSLYINPDKTRNLETVWSGTGSGCSAYEPKPDWQPIFQVPGACTSRSVADVAADADPNTGAAVYFNGNWETVGGTSLSAVIIAGTSAMASGNRTFTGAQRIYLQVPNSGLYRVTTGSNGDCGDYLCSADDSTPLGYNGPGGNGTPDGLRAF